ncbi:MAG: thioredoxin, partial [Rhodospirillaceae bacterium]|nr:thioredoxin [Rhodospirillaceae bacterium]
TKARLKDELDELLMIPGEELVVGAGGIDEGIPANMADKTLPKFRPGGLNIVRAGGGAGMFSAVIGGWAAGGEIGSIPVTKEITT